jgi:hypothetical protein
MDVFPAAIGGSSRWRRRRGVSGPFSFVAVELPLLPFQLLALLLLFVRTAGFVAGEWAGFDAAVGEDAPATLRRVGAAGAALV